MRWSDIDFHPPRGTLRQFGGLSLVVFGGLGAWRLIQQGPTTTAYVLLALAAVLGSIGLLWPERLRPVFVGWMILAFPIGWLVSHTVLAVIFFGLFTPLALLFRLTGRDALRLKRPAPGTSCWLTKSTPTNVASYFRQF
jgi:hypothetical protein